MFYYFGRKGRAARTYPAPDYPLVIEPFAGSMGYTMHYRPPFAIGIETEADVASLWRKLTSLSLDEIRDYPGPVAGERTTDRWHLLGNASDTWFYNKYLTANQFVIRQFEQQRALALRHHDYAINSVLYRQGDYRDAPDVEATWFIDPPYEGVQDGYRDKPNFEELAEWCMTRRGQVIICEGEHGSWLPFEHHSVSRGQPTRPLLVEKVLTRRTHARCESCAVTFPASRSDARFCSGRCRMRASRTVS